VSLRNIITVYVVSTKCTDRPFHRCGGSGRLRTPGVATKITLRKKSLLNCSYEAKTVFHIKYFFILILPF